MKRLVLAAAALCLATPAFAKAPTPANQPAAVGFLYTQLSPQRWRVGIADTGPFDGPQIERRILREAATLTLRQGFSWFAPIGERPEPVETKAATAIDHPADTDSAPSLHLTWGAACRGQWSFAPTPDGLCKAAQKGPADRWQATTQVMMGHGVAPANGLAFDARKVLKTP